uniref:Retrotransposon protein, putative, Ty1-copia subclass n=1 Tax=Tanacetum cinerariifolium TaxID=118510 RepID=A0A6L2L0K0_TANCI|nr:retrotransposon protein, putative, Ty1-copia subclass [Tanacetum cinerariifolium]
MIDDYNAFIKNNTWIIVPRPLDVNILRSMWLFRYKYNAYGSLSRCKARLMANGSIQLLGIDVDETFSSVVKSVTLCMVLSLALSRHWLVYQLDVKNVDRYMGLNKPLGHGFRDLLLMLLALAFLIVIVTPYSYRQGNFTAYLLLYVDDIVLISSFLAFLQRVIASLHVEFSITDLGLLNYFLGIFVTPNTFGMFLSQMKYATKVLRANMLHCNPYRISVDMDYKLAANGDHVSDPTLYRSFVGMSAKNALAIQRCELSRKELNEFLSSYSIPSEYRVILPILTQTILDALLGYIGLYTHCFSLANLRLTLNDFFCEAYDCEPFVELFCGFFNLCKAEMSFRNFIYIEDDEDLTFLPKDFSLGFNIGSPSVSINTEPVRADEEPTVEPTTEPATEPVNERVGTTADLGGSPKGDTFVVHAGSVVARIRERKCKTMGGSSRPPVKRKMAFGSSISRIVHAKASAIKDDTPVLSISDDDEGLEDCLELKDATACHLKISAITLPAWNGGLRELLEVIEELMGEADVMRARELAREEEYEELRAKCEAVMTDFDKNPAELDEVKHDRREVVSKVVPYACIELLHSDELGRLVGKLVSSAITFGRCRAYEQVARMKEPFNLSKVKGYRSSYEKEHT